MALPQRHGIASRLDGRLGRPGAAAAGGEALPRVRSARGAGQERMYESALRHGHRSGSLHGLRRLHGGLRGGEQRAARCRKRPPRTGITWMRVYQISNGSAETRARRSSPCLCLQCEHETPCASVCPQQAVEVDPATGIVMQMPQRCLGCRYCMTACPYHARYFNWWDPAWPAGMEKTLNPDVAPAHARRGGEMQLLPRPAACRRR